MIATARGDSSIAPTADCACALKPVYPASPEKRATDCFITWPPLLQLWLGENKLEGTLSSSWILPFGLYKLYLAGNELSGTIPAEWELPAGIREVMLHRNKFNGEW
jgi:hypothetical protein